MDSPLFLWVFWLWSQIDFVALWRRNFDMVFGRLVGWHLRGTFHSIPLPRSIPIDPHSDSDSDSGSPSPLINKLFLRGSESVVHW